ncbi:hypothetical protein DFH09DRAFT_1076912 [Mycena vulgaris]|nr:hypothetical protein DFH09DRAFT_1076912 [Mycena vulgaris]
MYILDEAGDTLGEHRGGGGGLHKRDAVQATVQRMAVLTILLYTHGAANLFNVATLQMGTAVSTRRGRSEMVTVTVVKPARVSGGGRGVQGARSTVREWNEIREGRQRWWRRKDKDKPLPP